MIKNPYLPDTPVNRAVEAALPNGMSIPAGYASANKRLSTPKVDQVENTIVVTADTGATIYYTTNGNTPTTSSSVYTEPVSLNSNATFKCIAVKSGFANSNVATKAFVKKLTCGTPSITARSNTFTISTATTGATIYYTTDGSTPTEESTKYEGRAVRYANSVMVKAIAVKDGLYNSEIASQTCEYDGVAQIAKLKAGDIVLFGTLTRLTITEVEFSADKTSVVRFTSDSTTATTLSVPETLWAGGASPELEKSHIYQIAWCNGVAVLTDLGLAD